MITYVFRVRFEDTPDIYRDIEIKPAMTFEVFHQAILQSIRFKEGQPASFYVCNDRWQRKQEITLMENDAKNPLMRDSRISGYVEDPHQRMVYVYDYEKMWTFPVELLRIRTDADIKGKFPACVKSNGEPPAQTGGKFVHASEPDEKWSEVADIGEGEEGEIGEGFEEVGGEGE